METTLDEARDAARALGDALDTFETARPKIDALRTYYEDGAWRCDFEANEAGLLPADLKRGVLSEDALFNLLDDVDRLNDRLSRYGREDQQEGRQESRQ